MQSIKIIIDDREHAVIPYFEEYKAHEISINVERINTGDYIIMYNNKIIMVIERKTWKDLASSIKDGRKTNVENLIELRNETNCVIFYIIEGDPIPKTSNKFCRIPYKNLRSHLDHLIIRDNIHIIHSKNQKHTVARIFEIIKNYLSIKPSLLLKYDDKISTNIHLLKKKKEINISSIINKIWCCIPYITEKTACLFINKGYHISDLLLGNITKDEIFTLKYDNGYIVGKRSERIWNNSRITDKNNKYFINMLSQINGITKKTASIILSNISFESLLNSKINEETMCAIQKTPKTKLGKKKSAEILNLFQKNNTKNYKH